MPKRFTLIELTVVVAILAILISMLMPSIEKAREASRSSVCLSKLSECGKAMSGYAKDNNMYYPGITGGGDYTDEGVLKPGGDASEWKICLMPYLGLKAIENNKNSQVFWCPSTKLPDLEEPTIRNKYAGGLALSREMGKVYYSTIGNSLTTKNRPLIKVPQVEIPSDTLAMGDTRDDPNKEKNIKSIPRPGVESLGVGNRHKKGMNVLWLDMSVRWKLQSELRSGANMSIDYYYLMVKE